MSHEDTLKEELIATDAEFRRLHEEHQAMERRLAELHAKSLLSEEDEIEEKQIKRHKLTLKDHMAQLLRRHDDARVAA